ncbi:MAG: metal-dependent hydrolase [Candidatus Woesearchaeota archaeon]
MFRTHRIFIILLCLIMFLNPYNILNYFNIPHTIFSIEFLIFMLIATFGSMMPDIDNPSSKLGRNVKIVGYVFKHRGFFHSLPALFLFTYIIFRFSSPPIMFTLAFFLGYLSHLLLDSLNYHGIYWFYPLKFRIKGFTKTKSLFEKALFGGNVFAVLVLLLYNV